MKNSLLEIACYACLLSVLHAGSVLANARGPLPTIKKDTVNVRDFGATGNGRSDDTKAIQTAIKSNAKVVFFPAGTYLISQTLALHSNIELLGDSQKSILQNSDVKEILKTFGPASYQNITLKGLKINGNLQEGDKNKLVICVQLYNVGTLNVTNCSFNNASAGIGLQNCTNITVQGCILSGMYQQSLDSKANAGVYGYGIVLNECSNAIIEGNNIGTTRSHGYIMRHAIYISNTGNASAVNSSNITIKKNTVILKDYTKSKPMTGFEYVFKSVGGMNILIENNKTTGGVGGVLLTYNFVNAINIRIINNDFSMLNRYGVFINPEATANNNCLLTDLVVTGNTFSMNGPNAQALRVINYKKLQISNNNFKNQYSGIGDRSIFMYIKKNNSSINEKEIDVSNNKVNGFNKMILNDDPKDKVNLLIR